MSRFACKLIASFNIDAPSIFQIYLLYSNMRRPVTHWYTKDQPIFENTEEMVDCRIDVTRIPGGADTPPCMKISHNTFETMEKANWEFLRLSLPVTCGDIFIGSVSIGLGILYHTIQNNVNETI